MRLEKSDLLKVLNQRDVFSIECEILPREVLLLFEYAKGRGTGLDFEDGDCTNLGGNWFGFAIRLLLEKFEFTGLEYS